MQEVTVEAAAPPTRDDPARLPPLPFRRQGARSTFVLLWLSETAFDLGTTLVSFAVGVWIFSRTGSAQDYSFSVLAAALAAMLVTPFAGVLADRHDRRWVVLSCDIAAIACTFAIAMALLSGRLGVGALYAYAAVAAAVGALRRPSIRVAVSLFVPKDRFAQVGGLTGISRALVQVGAPAAAGFLMSLTGGLQGVMATQLCLLLAAAALVFAALTRAGAEVRGGQGNVGAARRDASLWRGAGASFSGALAYLREQPLMRALLGYGALVQCLMVLATAMVTPLVLSTHSSGVLGLVMSVGIVGGLLGSILVATARLRQGLMQWVLACDALQCAAVLVAGCVTTPALWCAAAFVCLFCGSTSVACSHALWMRKAPAGRQGSVFALIAASNMLVMCAVLLAGGWLADAVLEPAMRPGGALGDTVVGAWFGTGPGRGIGLLFFATGAAGLVLTVFALFHRRLRRLETLVPDGGEA
ncbi:diaminobutyrate-2-oxoglutarate transaminase [Variovorax sp. NFACC28]|nr:diaminobutyrate-2-oxoglutarate transaminase [Variovorax sp. NFACC28]SEG96449.1 diaminobutyrate-2-oxoglutarate transaminase [Variovorax sp. NFACC29]SFD84791.1 diaminobutyrate-2-oxoglutarate transaminase [Variovorax sp. NFACC26]SFG96309.1 diaminobutyrate-2-oxoglutarate transaminase [Variovorax sp. NFACC27]